MKLRPSNFPYLLFSSHCFRQLRETLAFRLRLLSFRDWPTVRLKNSASNYLSKELTVAMISGIDHFIVPVYIPFALCIAITVSDLPFPFQWWSLFSLQRLSVRLFRCYCIKTKLIRRLQLARLSPRPMTFLASSFTLAREADFRDLILGVALAWKTIKPCQLRNTH